MSDLLMRPRRRPELNLVPLIDVLVMLIFFAFVTMQFKSATTLNLTMPKIETAGKNDFKGNLTIGIDKEGVISVNGKNVSEDDLQAVVVQVHNLDAETPVLIKADETSQLKKLTFVMDTCRKSGLSNIILQSR